MTDMEYSRNERSISSWISMGSMKPPASSSSVPVPSGPAVGRVVVTPWHPLFPSVAWPSSSQMSRNRTSFALVWMNWRRSSTSSPISTEQTSSAMAACSTRPGAATLARVHGGVSQLAEVHLAETLQPLEVRLVVRVLGQEAVSAASSFR